MPKERAIVGVDHIERGERCLDRRGVSSARDDGRDVYRRRADINSIFKLTRLRERVWREPSIDWSARDSLHGLARDALKGKLSASAAALPAAARASNRDCARDMDRLRLLLRLLPAPPPALFLIALLFFSVLRRALIFSAGRRLRLRRALSIAQGDEDRRDVFAMPVRTAPAGAIALRDERIFGT